MDAVPPPGGFIPPKSSAAGSPVVPATQTHTAGVAETPSVSGPTLGSTLLPLFPVDSEMGSAVNSLAAVIPGLSELLSHVIVDILNPIAAFITDAEKHLADQEARVHKELTDALAFMEASLGEVTGAVRLPIQAHLDELRTQIGQMQHHLPDWCFGPGGELLPRCEWGPPVNPTDTVGGGSCPEGTSFPMPNPPGVCPEGYEYVHLGPEGGTCVCTGSSTLTGGSGNDATIGGGGGNDCIGTPGCCQVVCVPGPAGPAGPAGPPGPPGPPGTGDTIIEGGPTTVQVLPCSPYVQNIVLPCPPGIPGPPGERGEPGPPGPKGPKGDCVGGQGGGAGPKDTPVELWSPLSLLFGPFDPDFARRIDAWLSGAITYAQSFSREQDYAKQYFMDTIPGSPGPKRGNALVS